eukprot:3885096-Pleurochrysis_carterae.AAC.3
MGYKLSSSEECGMPRMTSPLDASGAICAFPPPIVPILPSSTPTASHPSLSARPFLSARPTGPRRPPGAAA